MHGSSESENRGEPELARLAVGLKPHVTLKVCNTQPI
jgi:hypothetical protein